MLPPGRVRLTNGRCERVRVAHEYDRNRRGRAPGRLGVDGARCHDDIDLETTSSSASSRIRSGLPSAHLYSMATVRPST